MTGRERIPQYRSFLGRGEANLGSRCDAQSEKKVSVTPYPIAGVVNMTSKSQNDIILCSEDSHAAGFHKKSNMRKFFYWRTLCYSVALWVQFITKEWLSHTQSGVQRVKSPSNDRKKIGSEGGPSHEFSGNPIQDRYTCSADSFGGRNLPATGSLG